MQAVVLLGVNLRLVFGSASALLPDIRSAYDLSPASVALLVTGPLLLFAVVGPLAARAVRRWTVATVLLGCLVTVSLGTALRGFGSWGVLLVGSLVAGAGIAVANVLGPVLVRTMFPRRIGLMTGVLTALVSASAGLASALTVSLHEHVLPHWRAVLSAWALPAVLGVMVFALLVASQRRVTTT